MRNLPLTTALVVILIFTGSTTFAGTDNPVPGTLINGDWRSIHLNHIAQFYLDQTDELTISDVSSPEFQPKFQTSPGRFEFGFQDARLWLQFKLHNSSAEPLPLKLEIANPLLDELTLYTQIEKHYLPQYLGDRFPYHQREVQSNYFLFELMLPAHTTQTYYLSVKSTTTLSVPSVLYGEKAYIEHTQREKTLIGAFYGIIFGLAIYNLVIYFSTKEKSYLFYTGHALGNIYTASCFDGISYQLFPDALYWQSICIYASLCVNIWFLAMFTREYLLSRTTCTNLDKTLQALAALGILEFLVLVVWGPGKLISMVILSTLGLCVVLVILAGLTRVRQGFKPAKIFLAAFVFMLTPVLIGILNALNIFGFQEFTPYLHKFGTASEMLILSLALARRINELRIAEREAFEKANIAQADTRAKSEFLAKMSHEIRTPMNGVLGMSELLLDTPLQPKQKNYVKTIYHSGDALLHIINDILDYSKIESGKLELEATEFDLEQLLDECSQVFALAAAEKNLAFTVHLAPETPITLIGDPVRLRQVIMNLLGNAFKFTDQGEVTVWVNPVNITAEQCLLKFAIQDTGIGISEQAQQKLFKSFSQADSSTTRKFGGTGLGLAISKQLTELMAGTIGVDSAINQGATFWFTARFPLCDNKNDAIPAEPLSGKQALIIHSQERETQWLVARCHKLGVATQIVYNTADIHQFFQNSHTMPEVVIADKSHRLDLQKLCDDLSDHFEMPLPLLMVTHVARQQPDPTALAKVKCYRPIEKPISMKLFDKYLIHDLTETADTFETSQDKHEPPNLGHLKVLVAEDNPVNQMVIRGMLEKLQISPVLANNGAEAIQLLEQADKTYDLILMDCEMPEVDGFEATRIIRAREAEMNEPRIKIISLTAHAIKEQLQKAEAAGMDGHLIKPITLHKLQETLTAGPKDNDNRVA